jgi:hypothetical protein
MITSERVSVWDGGTCGLQRRGRVGCHEDVGVVGGIESTKECIQRSGKRYSRENVKESPSEGGKRLRKAGREGGDRISFAERL